MARLTQQKYDLTCALMKLGFEIHSGNEHLLFAAVDAYAVARESREIAELKAQVEGLKTDMQHSRLIEAAQVKESNELKAQIRNYELRIDSDAVELDKRYSERTELNAEIKRLRDALLWLKENRSPDRAMIEVFIDKAISPAPVTEGKAKPISNKCRFNIAYVGKCNKSTVSGDFCEQHAGMECRVCGKQATRECGVALQLVCGAPLCDKCTHNHDK